MPSSHRQVPEFLLGLVDDAAVFPPGNAPLGEAVRDHTEHRAAPYAGLVGPFVVSDQDLPRLAEEWHSPRTPALAVTVVVTGGAGAVSRPCAGRRASGHLELRGIEVASASPTPATSPPTPAGSSPRSTGCSAPACSTRRSRCTSSRPGCTARSRPATGWAPSTRWPRMDHRLKLRTGGVDADAFPAPGSSPACIGAALDRELAVQVHRRAAPRDAAPRPRRPGFEHHGFLNVLVATRASLDGAGPADVAAVLEERDAGRPAGRPATRAGCRRRPPVVQVVRLVQRRSTPCTT